MHAGAPPPAAGRWFEFKRHVPGSAWSICPSIWFVESDDGPDSAAPKRHRVTVPSALVDHYCPRAPSEPTRWTADRGASEAHVVAERRRFERSTDTDRSRGR